MLQSAGHVCPQAAVFCCFINDLLKCLKDKSDWQILLFGGNNSSGIGHERDSRTMVYSFGVFVLMWQHTITWCHIENNILFGSTIQSLLLISLWYWRIYRQSEERRLTAKQHILWGFSGQHFIQYDNRANWHRSRTAAVDHVFN